MSGDLSGNVPPEPPRSADTVRDGCLSVAAVLDMFTPPGDDACVLRWLFDE